VSDKENVLILDRISDFNSVISFYEETAELITKLRPNITMTEKMNLKVFRNMKK